MPVLRQARKPFELDAAAFEIAHRGNNVGNFPSLHRESGGNKLRHDRHSKRRPVRVEYNRETVFVYEFKTQRIAVENLRASGILRRQKSGEFARTENQRRSFSSSRAGTARFGVAAGRGLAAA